MRLRTVAAAVAAAVVSVLTACGSPSPSAQHYGGAPSFLPSATVPVNRMIAVSAAAPGLGIEGDAFAATVGAAHTVITVVGPDVPAEGLTPPPPTTPATFTITLSRSQGSVPLRPADFTVVDGEGRIHQFRAFDRPAGAEQVGTGTGPVSVRVTAVLATGPGTIRWAPLGRPVASWEFTVEID